MKSNKKYIDINIALKMTIKRVLAICLLFLGIALPQAVCNSETEQETKIDTRLDASVIQDDNGLITLQALARARIDKRYIGLPDLEIEFHTVLADSLDEVIGTAMTDENGMARLDVSEAKLLLDTSGMFEILVEFKGNDLYEGSSDQISILSASLSIEAEEIDSVKTLFVHVESMGESIADENVSLFVTGMFSPLKIGEETTDEEGNARFEFPTDLKGDESGNIRVFARMEDHSEYGTLIGRSTQSWGQPVVYESPNLPPALWSPNPPLWLLITFLAILIGIWTHYIDTVYKLYRLKKESRNRSETI